MTTYKERYRENAPGIYLALTSMIQAVALEMLVSRAYELSANASGAAEVAVILTQGASTLLFGFLWWVVLTQGLFSLKWPPGLGDTISPFALGILQLVAIQLTGPDHLLSWACLMCTILLITASILFFTLRDFDRFHENKEFTANIPRHTLAAFSFSAGSPLLAAAALFGLTDLGHLGYFGWTCAAVALQVVTVSIWLRGWWKTAGEVLL
jgi:hypothetical protein